MIPKIPKILMGLRRFHKIPEIRRFWWDSEDSEWILKFLVRFWRIWDSEDSDEIKKILTILKSLEIPKIWRFRWNSDEISKDFYDILKIPTRFQRFRKFWRDSEVSLEIVKILMKFWRFLWVFYEFLKIPTRFINSEKYPIRFRLDFEKIAVRL